MLIIGAGFGGLTLTRHLKSVPVDVTLIDHNNYHLFMPFVYQVASSVLSPGDIAPSVRGQIRGVRNADFLKAEVTGIDAAQLRVLTEHGWMSYDYLVLATGSISNDFGNGSVRQSAHPLKNLPDALAVRNAVMEALERMRWEEDPIRRKALGTFVIIGGGPVGVEYAGALSELLNAVFRKDLGERGQRPQTILLESGTRILPMFDARLGDIASRSLEKKGVTVRTGVPMTTIGQDLIKLGDGSSIAASTVIWAAGVRASEVGGLLGVELTRQGRVPVTRTLQVQAHPNVFVIGDLASHPDDLPMLIRPALDEAKYVAGAIHNLLMDRESPPFKYHDPGIMAVVGRGSGIAQLRHLRLSGRLGWLFWLAYHIMQVNTFRARFTTLINWTVTFLLREPPIRIELSASEQIEAPPGFR